MKKNKSFRGNNSLQNLAPGMPSRAERRGFLRAFLSGYYPTTCDDIGTHDCDPCEPNELGRIRSAAFIMPGALGDPTDPAEWTAGILAGTILYIPFTNGMMAEPQEKMIPGYGDNIEALVNYTFTATFMDPNFISNTDFYNKMAGNPSFLFCYRTNNHVFITPVTVTVVPKYQIENDLNSKIMWTVGVKWVSNSGASFPTPYTIPEGIFTACLETA